jgi:hypothetical protein
LIESERAAYKELTDEVKTMNSILASTIIMSSLALCQMSYSTNNSSSNSNTGNSSNAATRQSSATPNANATSSAEQKNAAPTPAASDADCAQPKYKNLSKYAGDNPDVRALFKDAEIAGALKALLKNDYQKLVGNMENIDITNPLVDRKGALTVAGGVPGAYTIAEGIFRIEPCGNVYAAILDQGKKVIFYTNDPAYVMERPDFVEKWRERFPDVEVEMRTGHLMK